MNRRSAIRHVVIVSAGAALLPSCVQSDKPAVVLRNISLTSSQQDMIAELAETIIPRTNNFIGAKDLNAHEFVLMMVDDCGTPENQKKFTSGMKEFEDICKKKYDKSFMKCTAEQRQVLLQAMEKKQDIPEDASVFYGAVKGLTIQSFTSSKPYMVDVRKYKIVPGGNFKGCVPIKKTAS